MKTKQFPAAALQFTDAAASIEFPARQREDEPRKCVIHGYSGARMSSFWFGNVVIDIAGVELGKSKGDKAILREHDPTRIVGHGKPSKDERGIHMDGAFSRATEDGRECEALADEKFPWQASVYVDRVKAEEVEPGKSAEVNGRVEKGPVTIFRKSRLREISLCVSGRDADTSAMAAAAGPMESVEFAASGEHEEEIVMANETDPQGTQAAAPATVAVDVEKIKSEALATGRLEGAKAEREKFSAFVAEFGELFAVEMFRAGKSADEARAEHYKRVKDSLAASQREIAEFKSKGPLGTVGVVAPAVGADPVPTGSRPAEVGSTSFKAAVEKRMAEAATAGEPLTKYQAMKLIQVERPDLDERS